MLLQDLKVSKGVEIFVTRDEYRYRLLSKIEAVEPGVLYVSLIAAGTRVFAFKQTDYIEIIYKDRDRIWKWSDVKAGIAKMDGYQMHTFASKKEGTSLNRRDTYRVQIMTAMEMTTFSPISDKVDMNNLDMDASAAELIAVGIEKSTINVVVKDISETGIGFYSPLKLKTGDKIRIRFLTEFGFITCNGSIVREVEQIWNRYSLFYGAVFTRVDKNLSKYIFAQQRLQLQREKR